MRAVSAGVPVGPTDGAPVGGSATLASLDLQSVSGHNLHAGVALVAELASM